MWLLGCKGIFDDRVTKIYGFHAHVNELFGLLLDTKVGPSQGASQLQHKDNYNDCNWFTQNLFNVQFDLIKIWIRVKAHYTKPKLVAQSPFLESKSND
jgi:hypothetical protein